MKPGRISTDCATKLAVLADPTRLAAIEVLLGGSLSHHLRVLRDAELVASCRDGKAVRYAATQAGK